VIAPMTETAAAPTTCPISQDSLSPTVQKSVGEKAPAPVRMMAARGMAPMAPKDLVTAQYVLTFDADEKVRQAAIKSLASLDERIANAVLSDANLSPFVLGHLAVALATKDAFAEKLLLNPATPSTAFAEVGKVCSENIAEIIANNQARLLEHPDIARALTKNNQVLKSTMDRVIDFLVRSNIILDGVAEFDAALLRLTGEERKAAVANVDVPLDLIADEFLTDQQRKELEARGQRRIIDESDDESADNADPTEEEMKPLEQRMRDLNIGQKVALATKGTDRIRKVLIRDPNRTVAIAAISSPAVREIEVVQAANSRMVHQDVIEYIARQKEWVKLYQVKHGLVQNPKTQLATAMKLMTLLQKKDIKILAKNKNVPMGVRNQAMRLSKDGE
jgi:hypothetical protein